MNKEKFHRYITCSNVQFLLQGHGAVQKGMPHKFYHGKTGKVFNVTKHAVGVIINKRVRCVYEKKPLFLLTNYIIVTFSTGGCEL